MSPGPGLTEYSCDNFQSTIRSGWGSLVGLSLAPEHRRGHGALYDAVNAGRVQVDRLRRELAGLSLPRDGAGRIVLGGGCQ